MTIKHFDWINISTIKFRKMILLQILFLTCSLYVSTTWAEENYQKGDPGKMLHEIGNLNSSLTGQVSPLIFTSLVSCSCSALDKIGNFFN